MTAPSSRTSSALPDGIVNRCELRVVGLKRSGNHAVINWVGKQFPGERVYFLNSCRPLEDPYLTKHDQDSDESIVFNGYRIDRDRDRYQRKDCLIYSYEDRSLRAISDPETERRHDAWVGGSLSRRDLLILRDPFNTIASVLQRDAARGADVARLRGYAGFRDRWVEYAREFVGETAYLMHQRTVVNYNEWTSSKDYRRALAAVLGLEFTDQGASEVVSVGGGSSFDGRRFAGAARRMDVLNRWRRWSSHPVLQELLRDEAVLALSARIFGDLPGSGGVGAESEPR